MGWSLGHYDPDRVDESDKWGAMLPPIKQTYTVDGKTYKV